MALNRNQFTHQGLWDVYNGNNTSTPPAAEHGKCLRILSALAAARTPGDIGYPVSSRSSGGYSIPVGTSGTTTTRITFRWTGSPQDIDYA